MLPSTGKILSHLPRPMPETAVQFSSAKAKAKMEKSRRYTEVVPEESV